MSELRPTRIWDLPTRVFHWALAAAVVAAVVSANVGAMVWHFRFGYCVFALLLFRILWGFVGGRWSRFGSFLPTPGRLLRYLRGRAAPGEHLDIGHSPLGALSVFALLAVLAVQVGTGLVGDDEISLVGPLNRFVDTATGIAATGWHKSNGKLMVIALVLLHVAAIVVYAVRGRRLVPPMLTGDKLLPAGTPASADGALERVLAGVLAAACIVFVAWVVSLGG
ncbi:MAG: cytochrome b/b6 domain-containing protein [Rubrivivax sp.]